MAVIEFKRQRKSGRISLVPMIDVLCCLLIFFMLSTQFVRWGALNVNVTTVGKLSEQQEQQNHLIKLHLSANKIRLNQEQLELTLLQLLNKLKTNKNNLTLSQLDISLSVNKATQLQFAVDVMQALQQLGIKKIKFEKNHV